MTSAIEFLASIKNYYGMSNSGSQAGSPQGGGVTHGVVRSGSNINNNNNYYNNNSNGGNSSGINKNMHAHDVPTMEKMREYEKEDKKENRESNAAWFGGIATIAFAAFSAFTLKSYYRDSEELKKAQDFRQNDLPGLPKDLQGQISPILNKHISILEASLSRSRNYAIIGAGMLASAAAGFAGGMFSIPWLITAAIIAAVFLTATAVFLIVWHWSDENSLPAPMQQKLHHLLEGF
jgi:hypothetical protein